MFDALNGIDHIHRAPCRTMMARTTHRDLWRNMGDSSPIWTALLWAGGAYCCLGSYLIVALPFVLRKVQPQTIRKRRPLYNLGWDTTHHILARLAAIAPDGECDLYHTPSDVLSPSWGIHCDIGPGEGFVAVLEVDPGLAMSVKLQWSGVEVLPQTRAMLERSWVEMVGEGSAASVTGGSGLLGGDVLQVHVRWKVQDPKAVPHAIGAWISQLAMTIHHGSRLLSEPSGEPAHLKTSAGHALQMDTLPESQRTTLLPAVKAAAVPSAGEWLAARSMHIGFQHSAVLGLLFALSTTALTGLVMMTVPEDVGGVTIQMVVSLLSMALPGIGILWWLFFTWYGRTPSPHTPAPVLALDRDTLQVGGAKIDLGRPFTVALSRPHDKRDSVLIALRQRNPLSPGAAVLTLRAAVHPSEEVDALPELDQRADWVPADALAEWVWPAIQSRAALHGPTPKWRFEA